MSLREINLEGSNACISGAGEGRTLAPVSRPNGLANRPLHHLSTAPFVVLGHLSKMAEGVGFEPTVPFEITSFQD